MCCNIPALEIKCPKPNRRQDKAEQAHLRRMIKEYPERFRVVYTRAGVTVVEIIPAWPNAQ